MAGTPESKVKEKARKLFKKHGVWYHFVANNGYGSSGCPDALLCVNGKFLGVEFKATAKDKPTALQQMQIDSIRNNKGLALVIHEDNLDVLEMLLMEIAQ